MFSIEATRRDAKMFIVLWVRLDFKLFLMDMLKPIFLSWRPNTKSFLQLKRRKVWQNVSTQGLTDFAVIDAGYIYVTITNRSTKKFVISVCENYNSKINVDMIDDIIVLSCSYLASFQLCAILLLFNLLHLKGYNIQTFS